MSVMNMNANDIVRQGIAGISEAHVLETVDNLNLKGNAKLSAVVAVSYTHLDVYKRQGIKRRFTS